MFKPSVKVTGVTKAALAFTIKDTTPEMSDEYPDGYGSAGAPADFTEVDSVKVKVQYTGETEKAAINVSGSLDTGLLVEYPLADGVYTIVAIFVVGEVEYRAYTNLLILNNATASIVQDVSRMALVECDCNLPKAMGMMDRILLKLAAQTAFNDCQYMKAHKAALLLNESSNSVNSGCSTC